MWFFALFLAIPLIEIALFVIVGGWLTLWPTLGIVLGTAFFGVMIMRLQGLRAISDMQGAMRNLENPVAPMAHSGMIMLAGLLLILPGFFTDTLGLLLLLPPVRHVAIKRMAGRLPMFSKPRAKADWRDGRPTGFDSEAIDAEYSEIVPERRTSRGNSRWTED